MNALNVPGPPVPRIGGIGDGWDAAGNQRPQLLDLDRREYSGLSINRRW